MLLVGRGRVRVYFRVSFVVILGIRLEVERLVRGFGFCGVLERFTLRI